MNFSVALQQDQIRPSGEPVRCTLLHQIHPIPYSLLHPVAPRCVAGTVLLRCSTGLSKPGCNETVQHGPGKGETAL
jgi:hypothetical protein